jgi:hypothetical protein
MSTRHESALTGKEERVRKVANEYRALTSPARTAMIDDEGAMK